MKGPTSPGVVFPPPVILTLFFILSILLQKWIPLDKRFFLSVTAIVISCCCFLISFFFGGSAVRLFFRSKTTVNTMKPASSLQTGGIYTITRNPMYVGLLFLYVAVALLVGNWWTIILIAAAIFVIQAYVIQREEKYLAHAFGEEYLNYKKKVRRWL